ncbi:WD40 repeat domain-containing protein [Hymenobacter sp. BT175]|uniref:WD40 repeat domain-containing protein n=1 Tax=Hymenobacter translucens TaxID=2886507 RepID=UPI001D0DEA83|nr:WD40 repeat domain-containing protein [Hymenobacter translucens]MCC2548191.1 WD40 repeat domain-containing protein [Hymenobacter translucens]
MQITEAGTTASRRFGPLASRQPTTFPAPVARWSTELGYAVREVAWLADHSAVLALTEAGQLVCLSAADGRPSWSETGGNMCLSASPGAPIVATGHLDGILRLRNAHTGKAVAQQRLGKTWIEHVSWSPDGHWLAAVAGPTLFLLDEVGRLIGSCDSQSAGIAGLSWRADSGAVALATRSGVQVVPVPGSVATTPEPSLPLSGGLALAAVAWSPTGRHLAAGCSGGGLVSWLLLSGAERKAGSQVKTGRTLSWHHAGSRLAAPLGSDIGIWEVAAAGVRDSPKRLAYHPVDVEYAVFQHRGDLLASADAAGTLALWNPVPCTLPLGVYPFGSGITALTWMANDCCLALGTRGGRVAVLSIAG